MGEVRIYTSHRFQTESKQFISRPMLVTKLLQTGGLPNPSNYTLNSDLYLKKESTQRKFFSWTRFYKTQNVFADAYIKNPVLLRNYSIDSYFWQSLEVSVQFPHSATTDGPLEHLQSQQEVRRSNQSPKGKGRSPTKSPPPDYSPGDSSLKGDVLVTAQWLATRPSILRHLTYASLVY